MKMRRNQRKNDGLMTIQNQMNLDIDLASCIEILYRYTDK